MTYHHWFSVLGGSGHFSPIPVAVRPSAVFIFHRTCKIKRRHHPPSSRREHAGRMRLFIFSSDEALKHPTTRFSCPFGPGQTWLSRHSEDFVKREERRRIVVSQQSIHPGCFSLVTGLSSLTYDYLLLCKYIYMYLHKTPQQPQVLAS